MLLVSPIMQKFEVDWLKHERGDKSLVEYCFCFISLPLCNESIELTPNTF